MVCFCCFLYWSEVGVSGVVVFYSLIGVGDEWLVCMALEVLEALGICLGHLFLRY